MPPTRGAARSGVLLSSIMGLASTAERNVYSASQGGPAGSGLLVLSRRWGPSAGPNAWIALGHAAQWIPQPVDPFG